MFTEFSQYWWLLLLLPLFHFGGRYFVRQKRGEQKKFFFQHNQNFVLSPFFWTAKIAFLGIGILFIMMAIFRPQWGQEIQKTEKKGLDIVFTIDVSKSMKALDFSHGRKRISRLDATKFLVENFITHQKSDRIGLIEFAGESFVASPLTLDHTVFLNFLNNISSDDLGKQGTNLAEALEVSLSRFDIQSTEKRGKAILLFSDGEETLSSDAEKMAERAKEKGIKIYTIGVGSENGAPIPEMQDAFGNIRYKTWKGKTVISALNPDPLKKIASITGGEYFHAEDISDLSPLSKKLETLPKKILKEENITPASEKYFWFVFFGIVFFAGGFVLPKYFFRKKL